MRPPRRHHYLTPAADEFSARVVDEAIETLGSLRGLSWLGDAGVTLHLLMSLSVEAQSRVARAVADARDQECSWAEIGDLLGVTRASTWQRYAGRVAGDRTPLDRTERRIGVGSGRVIGSVLGRCWLVDPGGAGQLGWDGWLVGEPFGVGS